MKKVFENHFLVLNFSEQESIIEFVWLPSTEDMNDQEYKDSLANFLTIMREFKPKYALADLRNMFFPITLELQTWVNEAVFPVMLEIGLQKSAILTSTELIVQLSIEQVMEEEGASAFQTKYFDDKIKAKEWLLATD